MPAGGGLERRDDFTGLEWQLARRFIRHQHGDLVDELLEALRVGLLIPENRQLVLNEWMPDNSQRGEFLYALDHSCPRIPALNLKGSPAHNLYFPMKEYQAVVVKLTRHTREDEDTLTDLLNERSRGGWEPALMSQDEQRVTLLFQRDAVGEG